MTSRILPAAFLLFFLSLLHCSSDEQSLGGNLYGSGGNGASGTSGAAGFGVAGTEAAGESGSTSTTARRICDGGDGVTLAFTIRGGGQLETGSYVQSELGVSSLFVDGHCQYWVINPDTATYQERYQWRAVHTGALSAAQEQQLAADFGYAQWPQLYGDSSEPDGADASPVILFDRSGSFSCGAQCKPATQVVSQSISQHSSQWIDDLYTQGAAVTTPMRARTLESVGGAKSDIYLNWTLTTSLDSLALADGADESHGDAPLISDPSDLVELRKLRDKLLVYNNPFTGDLSGVFVQQQTPYLNAAVFFRDTIPLENEHGLIPVP